MQRLALALLLITLAGCASTGDRPTRDAPRLAAPGAEEPEGRPSIPQRAQPERPPRPKEQAPRAAPGAKRQALAAARGCQPYDVYAVGNSLAGLIDPGAPLRVFPVECLDRLHREDLVVAKHVEHPVPLVKRLMGLAGDTLSLDEKGRLHINGEVATTTKGTAYRFEGERRELLTSAIAEAGEVVPEERYLLLGNTPGGTADSSRYGFAPREAIIGRALAGAEGPGRPALVNVARVRAATPLADEAKAQARQAREDLANVSEALHAVQARLQDLTKVKGAEHIQALVDRMEEQADQAARQLYHEQRAAKVQADEWARNQVYKAARAIARERGITTIVTPGVEINAEPIDITDQVIAAVRRNQEIAQ